MSRIGGDFETLRKIPLAQVSWRLGAKERLRRSRTINSFRYTSQLFLARLLALGLGILSVANLLATIIRSAALSLVYFITLPLFYLMAHVAKEPPGWIESPSILPADDDK